MHAAVAQVMRFGLLFSELLDQPYLEGGKSQESKTGSPYQPKVQTERVRLSRDSRSNSDAPAPIKQKGKEVLISVSSDRNEESLGAMSETFPEGNDSKRKGGRNPAKVLTKQKSQYTDRILTKPKRPKVGPSKISSNQFSIR